jgi:hypothetical protein
MTIAIKPTASGSTIEQNGSTILTVDGSGNITPSNNLYPKVPAFLAYNDGTQSLSASTNTKVVFDHESADTDSSYDTTNYRYTPSVAGYYQINVGVYYQSSSNPFVMLYKNTTNVNRLGGTGSGALGMMTGSALVYMNGTTDYLEIYAYNNLATTLGAGASNLMYFQAHLVSV